MGLEHCMKGREGSCRWGRRCPGNGHTMEGVAAGLHSPHMETRSAQASCVVSVVLCLVLQQLEGREERLPGRKEGTK